MDSYQIISKINHEHYEPVIKDNMDIYRSGEVAQLLRVRLTTKTRESEAALGVRFGAMLREHFFSYPDSYDY